MNGIGHLEVVAGRDVVSWTCFGVVPEFCEEGSGLHHDGPWHLLLPSVNLPGPQARHPCWRLAVVYTDAPLLVIGES